MSPPRSRRQRRADTEQRLANDVDLWVASASPDGEPNLVPLSFDWDGTAIVFATPSHSVTGRNLAASGSTRLGLGELRDVTMIDAAVEILPLDARSHDEVERFVRRAGFDPRRSSTAYVWFRATPRRIQAWRTEDELSERMLMRDGIWLD